MATPTTVASFVATSIAEGLTYAQMLECVKYALISGISDDGRMVTAVNSRGTAMTMAVEAARALLVTLDSLTKSELGFVASPGEFVSG
jgi:hypothetical protein